MVQRPGSKPLKPCGWHELLTKNAGSSTRSFNGLLPRTTTSGIASKAIGAHQKHLSLKSRLFCVLCGTVAHATTSVKRRNDNLWAV
eukprot:5457019-Amphidinium_carterae.1